MANLGSGTERRQLADLGAVAASCDAWNLPLLVMIYARGPRIADPHDPVLLAHAVNIAADLGADLVKTAIALPLDRMAEVVASCPVPVLAAGGVPDGSDLVGHGAAAMRAGCRGLAVGRRIFSAPSPRTLMSQLTTIVHADRTGAPTRQPIIEAGVA